MILISKRKKKEEKKFKVVNFANGVKLKRRNCIKENYIKKLSMQELKLFKFHAVPVELVRL